MAKNPNKLKKNDFIDVAKKRFSKEYTYEDENREDAYDDLLFKKGGLNQWGAEIQEDRSTPGQERPMFTINQVPQFCDQVIGDSRQNKIGIKVSPSGRYATKENAQIRGGLIRDIERKSHANSAYQKALECAVDSGRGAFRIDKEYESDEETAFEMALRINRIANPYSVYFDNERLLEDPLGRKQRYLFLTKIISRDDYRDEFPGKEPEQWSTSVADNVWNMEDSVRIAEYWVRTPTKKRIYLLSDNRVVDADDWDKVVDELREKERVVHVEQDGSVVEGPAGDSPTAIPGREATINEVPEILKEKTITSHEVKMYLIDGSQILDGPFEWEGKYIPVIPVWGKEIVIDNERYMRGIIRNAKDPARLYNYQRTKEIEDQELAPGDTPLLTPQQVEGHEHTWNSQKLYRYKLYNHIDNQAAPIFPMPKQVNTGNVALTQAAQNELHSTTGIYPPSLGQRSNETSGKAIIARERQGDTGTYEYHDNLAMAVEYCGEQLNDLISKIYNSERQIIVLGEDESEKYVTINETIVDDETGDEVILNDMTEGSYAVTVSVGPAYSTQRQETLDKLVDLAKAMPIFAQVGSDIVAKNLDFVGSDELMERIQKIYKGQGIIEDKETREQQQQQQQQPPDPEIVKKQLDVKKTQLDVKKKELEVQQELVQLKQMIAEIGKDVAQLSQFKAG